MTTRYERLTDSQWKVIKDFLPVQRLRTLDLRDIFDAILWITRTGSQWRNLDRSFPHWQAVYYYFYRWRADGTLERINQALNRLERKKIKKSPSPRVGLVDSQSVRLAPMIYEFRGIDGHKKVNGRKRQILTDTMGRLWRAFVHPANGHDSYGGIPLLVGLKKQAPAIEQVLGDSAYQGAFAEQAGRLGIAFQVPKRPQGTKGFAIEPQRWVVERSIAWQYFFRRLAIDYEHTIESSVGFLYLANISMVLAKIK